MDGKFPPVPFVRKREKDHLALLTVQGLSYRYGTTNGNLHGISNISLTLRRGSFTVITGRVGSGKSTFLKVLLGLLPPDSGEVYWNGQKVTDLASFFTPPRVAYTAQVPRLFSDSLQNNILLGLPQDSVDLPGAPDNSPDHH